MRFLVVLFLLCLPGLAIAQKRTAAAKKPVKKTAVAAAKKKPAAARSRHKGSKKPAAPKKSPEAVKRDKFIRLVKAATWQNTPNMVGMIQPAIALRAKSGPDAAPVGQSKLGGQPDLPPGLDWPVGEQGPMAFFAQFDLAELAKFDTVARPLPAQGMLYFFAWFPEETADAPAHDVVYKNPAEYRVLFYDGPRTGLQRLGWPASLPAGQRFTEAPVHPTLVFGLPPWSDWRVEGLRLPERDLHRLADFSSMYGVEEDHLLGYAYPLQDDPLRDWAMAQLRLSYPLAPAQEQRMEARRREFVHLLTLELSPAFSAVGTARAFWGIRREDLIKRDFGKTVLILQDVNALVQRK